MEGWCVLMRVVVLIVMAAMAVGAVAAELEEQPVEKRVTINVKDADLRGTLTMIFEQTGLSYSISEDVQGVVTAYIDNQTVDHALRVILSPRGFVWRKDGEVYLVSKKEEPKQEEVRYILPPDPPAPDRDTSRIEESKLEKVELLYSDAYDVVAMLQGGLDSRSRDFGPAGAWGGFPGGQRGYGQWGMGLSGSPYGAMNGFGNNNNYWNGAGYSGWGNTDRFNWPNQPGYMNNGTPNVPGLPPVR